MDCAHVYKDINPSFSNESFLKDFEILALDNLTNHFKLKPSMSTSDVRSYIDRVGDRYSNLPTP